MGWVRCAHCLCLYNYKLENISEVHQHREARICYKCFADENKMIIRANSSMGWTKKQQKQFNLLHVMGAKTNLIPHCEDIGTVTRDGKTHNSTQVMNAAQAVNTELIAYRTSNVYASRKTIQEYGDTIAALELHADMIMDMCYSK